MEISILHTSEFFHIICINKGFNLLINLRMDEIKSKDVYEDSFDNLFDNQQPLLRELNVIKKNVRASFNIDSSVENSNQNIILTNLDESVQLKNRFLDQGEFTNDSNRRYGSISTPRIKSCSPNIFNCALSPITGNKSNVFQSNGRHTNEFNIANSKNPVCMELRPIVKSKKERKEKTLLILKPGKWRKSLVIWRRTQTNGALIYTSTDLKQCLSITQTTVRGHPELNLQYLHEDKSIFFNDCNVSSKDYENQVLIYCQQRKPLGFETEYGFQNILNSIKIGEGAFGEVFKYTNRTNPNSEMVLKIIPIEGRTKVNGETQKTFQQILPEIIISQEMRNLRFGKHNSTSGFVDIQHISLVQGKYPPHLIKLWENYDKEKESDNDHPKRFTKNQLFVVLELKFAGEDLCTFKFKNAEQSYYALQQIMTTLAVAEVQYQFEHRDLHWGNILIKATTVKEMLFKLNGKILTIPSKGIRTTIIDYTLSRISVDEFCHYNDLSSDEELFEANGDYQYEIYRMMREELKNNWTTFAPKTNVLWLSYINAKLIDCVEYKSVNTKIHKLYIKKLKLLQNIMLTFESAANCINHVFNILET